MRVYATSKYSELLSRFYLQTDSKINLEHTPDDQERNFSFIYRLHIGILFLQMIMMPLFGLIGGWIIFITKRIIKMLIKDNKKKKNIYTDLHSMNFTQKLTCLLVL